MTLAMLKRIAEGDKTAVQECLKQYGGLVWSLAKRMSPTIEDAEDAVQEIFVDVWKNAARFDSEKSSETTFIAMIARRRLIDRMRANSSRLSPTSLDEMSSEPMDRFDSRMQSRVEASQAVEALRNLSEDQQQVITLSVYYGLSHQEISDRTGMPLGTVKTHARRGLLQMRTLLGISGATEEASI